MKVLITGGAGFFGRYFQAELAKGDHEVVAIDINPRDGLAKYGDARELEDGSWDLVIHLAAFVGGRVGIDNEPLHVAGNLGIDAAVFDWAARNKPGRLVYFSSAASYPMSLQTREDHVSLREDMVDLDHPGMPDSLYGWAKLTGEQLAVFLRNEGVPVTVVRPFSGYSWDQEESEYPFPAFIGRAARKENPFQIWGSGRQVRDWVHAEDVIRGVLALVDQGVDGPVNLGTGRPTDFVDLATIICKQYGYEPEFSFLEGKPTGPHHRVCDPTYLRNFYRPRVTLEEGVARSFEFYGRT